MLILLVSAIFDPDRILGSYQSVHTLPYYEQNERVQLLKDKDFCKDVQSVSRVQEMLDQFEEPKII